MCFNFINRLLISLFFRFFILSIDCSISKCESNTNCVLGRYEGMNDIDEDDCTATEKLWVSYEAYHNRESEKSNTFVIIIFVFISLL